MLMILVVGYISKKSKNNSDKYKELITAFWGGVANGISRTCVAPFERARMQMITDSAKFNGSSVACMKEILDKEGIRFTSGPYCSVHNAAV